MTTATVLTAEIIEAAFATTDQDTGFFEVICEDDQWSVEFPSEAPDQPDYDFDYDAGKASWDEQSVQRWRAQIAQLNADAELWAQQLSEALGVPCKVGHWFEQVQLPGVFGGRIDYSYVGAIHADIASCIYVGGEEANA